MSRTKTCQIAPLSLRSPKVNTNKTLLALSVPGMLMSPFAMAQEDEPIVLDTMQIEERTVDTNPYAQAGAPYKAQVSGDSRHVKELADTPQTISVLTQTQIQESGKTDLKDILAAQPGITLGTGENGNAFGDRYIIRGHEARSDVFVDGLRDPGMTTRESFATEQVEITKGPSSTFAGRGSTGGAVNSITKQASTEYDFSKLEAGLGTDDYRRIALDSNKRINDDLAVRANILHSYKEIPDRGPADQERNGLALSVDYHRLPQYRFPSQGYLPLLNSNSQRLVLIFLLLCNPLTKQDHCAPDLQDLGLEFLCTNARCRLLCRSAKRVFNPRPRRFKAQLCSQC